MDAAEDQVKLQDEYGLFVPIRGYVITATGVHGKAWEDSIPLCDEHGTPLTWTKLTGDLCCWPEFSSVDVVATWGTQSFIDDLNIKSKHNREEASRAAGGAGRPSPPAAAAADYRVDGTAVSGSAGDTVAAGSSGCGTSAAGGARVRIRIVVQRVDLFQQFFFCCFKICGFFLEH